MRIIFMSATKMGFECLKKLLERKQKIIALYTVPRSFKISYSKHPVKVATYKNFKQISKKFKIPIIETANKMREYINQIRNLKPDFILAIGWYYMIPKIILDIPPLGCAGIHASLLPQYRGGAPLVWVIINGEKETGVSFFYFAEGVDNGDIIAQKEFPIAPEDNIETIYHKATKSALKILEKYIPLIERGRAPRIKQDETKATYFPQRQPEDGLIDWNKSSWEIYNWIRAQTKPYPGAFFLNQKGQKIKIWSAKIASKNEQTHCAPGTIIFKNRKQLKIATKNSYIIITDWKIEK